MLRIPQTVPILFEMETLKDVTPSYLNSFTLLVVHEEIYSLFDEFSSWLIFLIKKSEYFEKIEKVLKICYCYIIEDCINYAFLQPNYKKLANMSKKFFMKNFLNFFEIFLNELRKAAFAFGLFEDPKVLSGEKVAFFYIYLIFSL